MDNKDVPYIVHEGDMSRMERTNKRLWVVILMLIVLLVGSNVAWLMYESQFSEEKTVTNEVTQELDTDGGGDAIINDGVHINGKSKTDKERILMNIFLLLMNL